MRLKGRIGHLSPLSSQDFTSFSQLSGYELMSQSLDSESKQKEKAINAINGRNAEIGLVRCIRGSAPEGGYHFASHKARHV